MGCNSWLCCMALGSCLDAAQLLDTLHFKCSGEWRPELASCELTRLLLSNISAASWAWRDVAHTACWNNTDVQE